MLIIQAKLRSNTLNTLKMSISPTYLLRMELANQRSN